MFLKVILLARICNAEKKEKSTIKQKREYTNYRHIPSSKSKKEETTEGGIIIDLLTQLLFPAAAP